MADRIVFTSGDRFVTIFAQLENINRQVDREEHRLCAIIEAYRAALTEITTIKPDDRGNGLRLAIAIAEQAIRAND